MNITLIDEMAKDLSILRENHEDEKSWQYRVKYSVLGLQMLASLYDKNDDLIIEDETLGNPVSHQHTTNRASRLAQVYGLAQSDVEMILELYKKTGFILSKRNRLAYPNATVGQIEGAYIIRGIHPSKANGVSGICMMANSDSEDVVKIDEMFGFPQLGISKWFAKLQKTINNWRLFVDNGDIEYLNINDPTQKGYWNGKPPTHGGQTLCRSNDKLNYWILTNISGNIKCAALPTWRTRDGEYYRIAIALRIITGKSPKVIMKKHRNTASIKYDYLLPPAEQNFIELCSWREDDTDNVYLQRLHRIISIELYQSIFSLFERMGYFIEEE